MPMLVWIKSRQSFLKVMEGSGDNLDREDVANGMSSYVMYSEFRPASLDSDEELEMVCTEPGGMLMFPDERPPMDEALRDCYEDVAGRPYDEGDVVILINKEKQ